MLIRPVKVILILLVAWIINRVIHRIIDRGVRQLVASQEEKTQSAGAGPEEPAAAPGRLAALRALTQRRTERATDALDLLVETSRLPFDDKIGRAHV